MASDSKPKLVYQIIIKAPQERVWEAITKPEFTSRYYYGSTLKTDLTVGSPFTYHMPDGSPIVEGEVMASEPPNRLVHTYHSLWPPMNEDAPTKVTWELESMPGSVTKVTSVPYQIVFEVREGVVVWIGGLTAYQQHTRERLLRFRARMLGMGLRRRLWATSAR
jgi:uncharacterized protein YndB with AHSA1/START domain